MDNVHPALAPAVNIFETAAAAQASAMRLARAQMGTELAALLERHRAEIGARAMVDLISLARSGAE